MTNRPCSRCGERLFPCQCPVRPRPDFAFWVILAVMAFAAYQALT